MYRGGTLSPGRIDHRRYGVPRDGSVEVCHSRGSRGRSGLVGRIEGILPDAVAVLTCLGPDEVAVLFSQHHLAVLVTGAFSRPFLADYCRYGIREDQTCRI